MKLMWNLPCQFQNYSIRRNHLSMGKYALSDRDKIWYDILAGKEKGITGFSQRMSRRG